MNRSRTIISTLLITLFIASCETIPSEPSAAPSASTPAAPSGLRSIVLGDQTFSEEQFGKFVSWRCGDFHDYNSLGDTLVEVGSFANSEIKGMGFVLYDNSYSGVPVLYSLINRQQWLQQSQQFEKLYASRFAKKRRTLQKTA
jgi:hypothetical protein